MLTLERAVYRAVHSSATSSLRHTEVQQTEVRSPSCETSLPPLLSRSTVQTSLFNFWTSPMCGLKDETTTFTSSTFSPLLPQSMFSSKQIPGELRFHGTLAHFPDLLAAIARLLARHQPHNAPSLHTAWTIQQVRRAEFHILEVLNYELATPTPAAWIEIFERRLSLCDEQQLLLPQHPNHQRRLTVRISLQTLMFRSTPSARFRRWFVSLAFCVRLIRAAAR